MLTLVILITRNEEYSVYHQLILHINSNCILSGLFFFIYVIVEVILAVDFGVNALVNFASLYLSCLTMKFWLDKIWLVPKYILA